MGKTKVMTKIMSRQPHFVRRRRVQDDERPDRKETREDAQNFYRHAGEKDPARPTKRFHGTKKVKNRAAAKRAKRSRKRNRGQY